MRIDEFLARLDKVKRTGPNQWQARCSAADHNDAHPSLRISVGRDERILVNCRSRGCAVDAIAAGAGVSTADLFNGERRAASLGDALKRAAAARPSSRLPGEDELVRWAENLQCDQVELKAIYEAKGWRPDLLAALGIGISNGRFTIPVRALDRKLVNISRYRPSGSPKVIAAAGQSRVPLYLLTDEDLQVWTEGEADAISARTMGFSSVGIPGASSRPGNHPDWVEPACGHVVVLSFDNDKAGADAEAAWAPALAKVAERLVIVRSPVGKDLGDFVRKRRDDLEGARAVWLELVAAAPRWEPQLQPPPEPEEADDTSVGRIRRALFEDTESTREGSDVVRVPVPETGGLLWRGLAHSVFGDRGEGKSITTVIVTVSAAVAGERVLYLDRENGPALTRSLVEGVLEAHPDWPDVLEGGEWSGRHYPAFDREWDPADYAEAIVGRGYTGVVYDSVREVISELGGDPNSDEDCSTLQRVLVTPLLRRGLWVVLLDNVGHQEKGRPKGSGAKLDAVPIAYQMRTTAPFDPAAEGAVEIKCTRSRYGDTGREWGLAVGAGRFDLPAAREEPPDERAARELDERFERFYRGVVAELAKHGPLGAKELMARVKGARKPTLKEWLSRIVADPDREVVHDDRIGYSLRNPVEGGSAGGAPRSPKGSRPPQTTASGDTPSDDVSDEALVARLKDEFDAVEVDPDKFEREARP